MGDKTGIQWTEATWNPIVGCSILSAGCKNCYAMGQAARLERMGVMKYVNLTTDTKVGPVWNGNVALDERSLDQPLRWKRPRIIFVNSMSDLFHEALTDAQIDQVFAVMALSPTHTFQVVTKRPDRMWQYLTKGKQLPILDAESLARPNPADGTGFGARTRIAHRIQRMLPVSEWHRGNVPWPLRNVWLGVSVESQAEAGYRIPWLLGTPAALRFISCEPLLGPLDITNGRMGRWDVPTRTDVLGTPCEHTNHGEKYVPVDWVIVGGESGPRARTCRAEWIYDLVRQCQNATVPVFVKQLGARYLDEENMVGGAAIRLDKDVGRDLSYRLKHRKGADMAEWPERLRVRQMPGEL